MFIWQVDALAPEAGIHLNLECRCREELSFPLRVSSNHAPRWWAGGKSVEQGLGQHECPYEATLSTPADLRRRQTKVFDFLAGRGSPRVNKPFEAAFPFALARPPRQNRLMKTQTIDQAKGMLIDVLDFGCSYREAGSRHGIARSTAERQVKALVKSIAAQCPIAGLDDAALSSLALLRSASAAVLRSMKCFDPTRTATVATAPRSFDDLPQAIRRLRARSENPNRDVALLVMLFSSGA